MYNYDYQHITAYFFIFILYTSEELIGLNKLKNRNCLPRYFSRIEMTHFEG